MKKLTTLLTLIALTSGAAAISGTPCFAKGRVSSAKHSHSSRKSVKKEKVGFTRTGFKHKKARKSGKKPAQKTPAIAG